MAPKAITMRLLARGTHLTPRGGCSIGELASVLAGDRWDCWPSSVHPALAVVASTVNDQLPDDRRRLLVPFAPWLLHTNQPDPGVWPATARLCAEASGSSAPPPESRRVLRQVRAAIRTMGDEQALGQVLLDCLNICRQAAAQAPVDPRLPLEQCPAELEVEPFLAVSPGCDWLDLHYRVHVIQ